MITTLRIGGCATSRPDVVAPQETLVRTGELPLERARASHRLRHGALGTHGPTLEVAARRRVLDRPVDEVWPGDRFGVLAELRVPAHTPGSWRSTA